jgi:pimeloyl-ACP methyl ester carboxylesterase
MSSPENTRARDKRLSEADDVRGRLLANVAASERRLHLSGVSTAVLEAGEGPPVVILHGVGQFAATWTRVIPLLAATHRVVVPDLPGQGASEVADGPLDAERVLGWLGELIEKACPSPPVLVGHESGGTIAARFAGIDGGRISRLVLVDTLGLAPLRPAPRFALAMVGFLARPTEQSFDRMLGQCVLDLGSVQGQLGERWELIAAYGVEGARTPEVRAAGRRLMKAFGVSAISEVDLARITIPTTLIWGRHDRQARLRVGEAASARYGWPLHVIEDCATDPHVEQPEALVEALHAALAGR